MPTTLPCSIGPGGAPGKLTYSVSLDNQRISGEAEVRELWLANGAKPEDSSSWIGVRNGFVAVQVETSERVGAVVSVILPGCRRMVVRRTSLQLFEDTCELEKPRGLRKTRLDDLGRAGSL